ncbi:hypothetical protein SAMN05444162_3580 [Paenibacillaceae bacterium GAS479]|nr:hypothetical protein SAMN05444162_3580 [Paenibacillaceae bacterium GAS479]
MDQKNVEIFNGSNLGIVLVLFILLVIVTQVFGNSVGNEPDDISIAGSVSFNVYNEISSLSMESISLTGDFESPPPLPHIIPPGGYYNFQVKTAAFKKTTGTAVYRVNIPTGSYTTVTIKMNLYGGPYSSTDVSISSDYLRSSSRNNNITVFRSL